MIPILTDRNLGLLVRDLRRQSGLTQSELGKRTHTSKSGISKREIDARAMHVGALLDTGRALGYTLALIPPRHRGTRTTGTGWPT